ncbi:hypothetical protein [Pseudoduganella ginsengisoli]|uniref:hypothetical protein n=1 Tax=Pseudoduganella ginsengisoli TaxID=1462440 RepID=UPI0014792470|nr:hypothetical protein [Pseudoduganella ginsengisoli]
MHKLLRRTAASLTRKHWNDRTPALAAHLKKSGVTPEGHINDVFLIRADGPVISADYFCRFQHVVFNRAENTAMMAVDSIVVPEKAPRETARANFTLEAEDCAHFLVSIAPAPHVKNQTRESPLATYERTVDLAQKFASFVLCAVAIQVLTRSQGLVNGLLWRNTREQFH